MFTPHITTVNKLEAGDFVRINSSNPKYSFEANYPLEGVVFDVREEIEGITRLSFGRYRTAILLSSHEALVLDQLDPKDIDYFYNLS